MLAFSDTLSVPRSRFAPRILSRRRYETFITISDHVGCQWERIYSLKPNSSAILVHWECRVSDINNNVSLENMKRSVTHPKAHVRVKHGSRMNRVSETFRGLVVLNYTVHVTYKMPFRVKTRAISCSTHSYVFIKPSKTQRNVTQGLPEGKTQDEDSIASLRISDGKSQSQIRTATHRSHTGFWCHIQQKLLNRWAANQLVFQKGFHLYDKTWFQSPFRSIQSH